MKPLLAVVAALACLVEGTGLSHAQTLNEPEGYFTEETTAQYGLVALQTPGTNGVGQMVVIPWANVTSLLGGGGGSGGYGVPEAVTISAGGVATITNSAEELMAVVLSANGGPGADQLDTITLAGVTNGTNIQFSVASGHTITFADGVGNLDLGANMVLNDVNETIVLRYNGTNYVQGSNSANIETVEEVEVLPFPIMEPDQVYGLSDDVKLFKFAAEKYPNGVTITAIHIDASAAYTSELFTFEEWDDASGTTQTLVEAITVVGISDEDDGIDDGAMAADSFLVLNGDDTPEDVAEVLVTVIFTVNP